MIELGKLGQRPCSVTSDSKLCALSAIIFVCRSCDHLQKGGHSDQELESIRSVYRHYAPHHLAGGNEQLVFPENLPPRPRTYHVLENLSHLLPRTGKLFDIGTGNGAVLRSAGKILPGWEMDAFDIIDEYRDEVTAIPGVRKFFSGSLEAVPHDKYDLIILWHVLEHLSDPPAVLNGLGDRLADDGHILIQVPDIERNPFDLAVIDHYSHFTGQRLNQLVNDLKFEVAADRRDLIHNCLTILIKGGKAMPAVNENIEQAREMIADKYFSWLNQAVDYFAGQVNGGDYAIFGTGMASLWLGSQLQTKPRYFIDEDQARTGGEIEGIKIMHPAKMMSDTDKILMPFTPFNGRRIGQKLQKKYSALKNRNFIYPEPFAIQGDTTE